MSTPHTLSDLKYEPWVINVKPQHSAQVAAESIFAELFPENAQDVTVNFLFSEKETNGDFIKVYEAYKGSDSTDYMYLIVRV